MHLPMCEEYDNMGTQRYPLFTAPNETTPVQSSTLHLWLWLVTGREGLTSSHEPASSLAGAAWLARDEENG
jgi:hypothetical protein